MVDTERSIEPYYGIISKQFSELRMQDLSCAVNVLPAAVAVVNVTSNEGSDENASHLELL